MRSSFAEHGIPSKLITDNELQYNCREFRQFKEAYGLQHISSPVSSVERIYRVHGTDREKYTTMEKKRTYISEYCQTEQHQLTTD